MSVLEKDPIVYEFVPIEKALAAARKHTLKRRCFVRLDNEIYTKLPDEGGNYRAYPAMGSAKVSREEVLRLVKEAIDFIQRKRDKGEAPTAWIKIAHCSNCFWLG